MRDFVHTSNVDSSHAGYMSQKKRTTFDDLVTYLIKTQLVFIELQKLAQCRISNMRLQNFIYIF